MSRRTRSKPADAVLIPPRPLPVGRDGGPNLVAWLIAAYLLLIAGGYMLLRQTGIVAGGNELSAARAWFVAINAATLTGFQATPTIDTFLPAGQIIVWLLVVGGTFLSWIIGALAVRRIAALPYTDRQTVVASLVYGVVCILAGTIALLNGQRSILPSLTLSLSALGNCGLVMPTVPSMMDLRTHLVLLPLVVLGGLGVPVLMEAFDWLRGRAHRLSAHSRTVLGMTAGLYVLLLVVLLLVQVCSAAQADPWTLGWQAMLVSSSTTAINSRSAGLPFQYAYAFPRAMQWVVLAAMVIGASPGGTGGGMKTTTLAVLFGGAVEALRGRPVRRPTGIAWMWCAAYLLIIAVPFLWLVITTPQSPADRLLFETASAVGNVGLSYDMISMESGGWLVLSAAMLLGRLLPFAVLWWSATTARQPEVAIG